MSLRRPLAALVSSLAVLALGADALAAPPAMTHVRGTVKAITAKQITVATAHGDVSLPLAPSVRVAGVVPASIADVKPGTFIGSANVPAGKTARALEVVVFPAAMRGTGEGDYPWDLPGGGSHMSSMTNGTVGGGSMSSMSGSMAMSGSSMTNANVTHMTSAGGAKVVDVSYKGGSKVIAIEPGTPIVRVGPATLAAVKPGAHVFVVDVNGVASRIVVGEKGAVPPM
ncbi:MAG TPA: hypothetical protein VMD91_18285 [Candidatus Sulfotelmatobacter sp.]|nr:hypothetical protein [Candidatus Sulfotelmatobacter sp.]